ncbi:hypothetical protein IMZ48_39960 [Candidatus Bathyarchaeota archaeon]|nr:hypothetical protein [Candidatus Bathyarchaeota archaeon]
MTQWLSFKFFMILLPAFGRPLPTPFRHSVNGHIKREESSAHRTHTIPPNKHIKHEESSAHPTHTVAPTMGARHTPSIPSPWTSTSPTPLRNTASRTSARS